jgi:hypothetical protein
VRSAAIIFLALSLGCGAPPSPPPTAVIDASPSAICQGDAFETPIEISGARSAVQLSLVPSPPDPSVPLEYTWELEGAEHMILEGALENAELTIATAGDRPLHVALTVTDEEGGRARTVRTIGLVIASASSCEAGCETGTSCVEREGGALCLPNRECASDDDCGCFVCDLSIARCVPPETP